MSQPLPANNAIAKNCSLPSRDDLMNDHKASFSNSIIRDQTTNDAWKETAEVIEKFSDATTKQWKDEIDALLTFASLFAGFITLFLGQTYPMLRQAQPDLLSSVLIHMSGQMASFAVNPSFVNTTSPPFDPSVLFHSSGAPPGTVWLNSLLFVGLVLALAAASVGLLTQQWLNAYTTGLFGQESEVARRRQYRVEQMYKWKIPGIIAMIPVLLQTSLILFLAALSILLFSLDEVVAAIVLPFVYLLLAFITITTVLPTFYKDCSYYSLQSEAFFHTVERIKKPLGLFTDRLGGFIRKHQLCQEALEAPATSKADDSQTLGSTTPVATPVVQNKIRLTSFSSRMGSFIRKPPQDAHVGDNEETTGASGHSSITPIITAIVVWLEHSFDPHVWRQHELFLSYSRSDEALKLDGLILSMAFKLTMDASLVRKASKCLLDRENFAFFKKYIDAVGEILRQRWVSTGPSRWLNGVVNEYLHILNVALQYSLAHSPDEKSPQRLRLEVLELIQDITTRANELPQLANTDSLPTGIVMASPGYRPGEAYNDLFFEGEQNTEDRARSLRLLAILSMNPDMDSEDPRFSPALAHTLYTPGSPARMAWDCMVSNVLRLFDLTPCEILSVSAAAYHVFTISRNHMDSNPVDIDDPQSKSRTITGCLTFSGLCSTVLTTVIQLASLLGYGVHDPKDALEAHCQAHQDYMDALRMYLHCLRISTGSAPPNNVQSTGHEVLALYARLLRSDRWEDLCRNVFLCKGMASDLRFDEVTDSIATLLKSDHTREFVTDDLLDGLRKGMGTMESTTMPHSPQRTQAANIWYMDLCRRAVDRLQNEAARATAQGICRHACCSHRASIGDPTPS